MRTTGRTQRWLARAGVWWANAWRWVLLAAGAVLSVYFLLDAGLAGNAMMAARP